MISFDRDDFLLTCFPYPFTIYPFTAEAKLNWEFFSVDKLLLLLLELFDSLELFFLVVFGLNDADFAYGFTNAGAKDSDLV